MYTSTTVGSECFDAPNPAGVCNRTPTASLESSGQGGVRSASEDDRARWEQGLWKATFLVGAWSSMIGVYTYLYIMALFG